MKKALFIALLVVVFAIAASSWFKPADQVRVAEIISQRAKPVPADQITGLVACIAADSCLLPRRQIMVAGKNLWSVELADQGSSMLFAVDGNKLMIMVTTIVKGQDWPILIEDTGTGMVLKVIRLDEQTRSPVIISMADKQFGNELLAAQALYTLAMRAAAEEIIPPRTMKTT